MEIITTSYVGPDLDGYSCAVAYAELLRAQGKNADACIWGEPHLEVQWLIKTFGLYPVSVSSQNFDDVQVILLDASSPEDLPAPLKSDQVVEVIDHRKIHRGAEFKNAVLQIEMVGAAATLVAERFRKANVVPSQESALLLYGGILSNTQNFMAVGTTERDREIADQLRQIARAPEDLAQQMFTAKSDLTGERLQNTLLGDTKVLTLQGKTIVIAQLEIFDAKKLIDERAKEIQSTLENMKLEKRSDFTFANLKDLKLGISYIFCADEPTATLLQSIPDVTWNGRLGESKTLTLRKQLSAWIDDHLKTYV